MYNTLLQTQYYDEKRFFILLENQYIGTDNPLDPYCPLFEGSFEYSESHFHFYARDPAHNRLCLGDANATYCVSIRIHFYLNIFFQFAEFFPFIRLGTYFLHGIDLGKYYHRYFDF